MGIRFHGAALARSGSRDRARAHPFAAQLATRQAVKTAMDLGLREADIIVKGPGPGREAALRALSTMGLTVRSISDVTPVPHNGCRPPKRRRV
jgi:small subunit ribosomal protein S11